MDFRVDLDDPDYPPAEMMRRIRLSELDQYLAMERSFARYAVVAYTNLTAAATVGAAEGGGWRETLGRVFRRIGGRVAR